MNRIETIIMMVNYCNTVADIGTDHCYIPEKLIKKNICRQVIASDINSGPYNIAKKYVKKMKLEDKICLRQGNGLEVLKKNEADIIIIAGMGGLLINKIVEDGRDVIGEDTVMLLQPMNAEDKVRKYLAENYYNIIKEELVKEDKKFYQIIKAKKCRKKQIYEDEIFFQIGYNLYADRHFLFNEFVEKKILTNSKIIKNLEKSKENKEKLNEIINFNYKMKEYLIKYEK